MKRYILTITIFLLTIMMVACNNVNHADQDNISIDATTAMSINELVAAKVLGCNGTLPAPSYRTSSALSSQLPSKFQSIEDLINARKEVNPEQDSYGLIGLECYEPAYAKKLLELTEIEIHYVSGGISYQGSTMFSYYMAGTDRGILTLEFSRAHNYMPETLLQNWVKLAGSKPLEGAEGVYYSGVSNPWDDGNLSFTEFTWVYDDVCFRMEVFPGALESILKYDPEALKGSLFELVKIDMDTGKPITAPTPPPAADTVPSTPGGDVPSVPNQVTPPDAVPTAVNPPASADTPATP